MNNTKIFQKFSNEVKELECKILETQKEIRSKKAYIETLTKEIEKYIIQWALDNPIEVISYYMAKELDVDTIYYKNDNNYVELFEKSIDSISEYKNRYILINIDKLQQTIISVKDICRHYSNLLSDKKTCIVLESLNNYTLDLIKESGKFIGDNNWDIEYKALKNKEYSNFIYEIIQNNFIINELESSEDELIITQENIDSLLNQSVEELELNYSPDNTFALYNKSDLIGFIDLNIYINIENKHTLTINSFEIFSKYRDLGFGSKVISILKDRYGLDIEGYSYPDDKVVNFWAINGADFDSCENCEENPACDGFECDEPLDYCFVIPSDKI